MNPSSSQTSLTRLVIAFAMVYIAWGTTYWAIRLGVNDEGLPPALFGGVRVFIAGALLLAYIRWSGVSIRLPKRDAWIVILVGIVMFVGGNGVISFALQAWGESAAAAVLAATCPMWVGLFAMIWPNGERLSLLGWLGLLLGLAGVVLLLAPDLHSPAEFVQNVGPALVLVSAAMWALGSVMIREARMKSPPMVNAAYQMLIGGLALSLVGVAFGELDQMPSQVTFGAVVAFMHLLIVGSLIGFVAFNYLLAHVSAAKVGTYAYANPVVAILIGWIAGETMHVWLFAGISVILLGVWLVRSGRVVVKLGQTKPVDREAGTLPVNDAESISKSPCRIT